jgi:hypothetical protein
MAHVTDRIIEHGLRPIRKTCRRTAKSACGPFSSALPSEKLPPREEQGRRQPSDREHAAGDEWRDETGENEDTAHVAKKARTAAIRSARASTEDRTSASRTSALDFGQSTCLTICTEAAAYRNGSGDRHASRRSWTRKRSTPTIPVQAAAPARATLTMSACRAPKGRRASDSGRSSMVCVPDGIRNPQKNAVATAEFIQRECRPRSFRPTDEVEAGSCSIKAA